MSGSGKSVALNTFEDLDFYCVDNLPADLLPQFVQSVMHGGDGAPAKLAVGIDVRNRHSDLADIPEWLSAVGKLGLDPQAGVLRCAGRRAAQALFRHPPPPSAEPVGAGAGRFDLAGTAGAAAVAADRRCRRRHQQHERAPAASARDHRVRHWRRHRHVAAVRIVRLPTWRAGRCRLRLRCARPAQPALGRHAAAAVGPRCRTCANIWSSSRT